MMRLYPDGRVMYGHERDEPFLHRQLFFDAKTLIFEANFHEFYELRINHSQFCDDVVLRRNHVGKLTRD